MTRASICAIGTELTRGIIKDTNSSLISRELTRLGVHVCDLAGIPDDGSLKSYLSSRLGSREIIVLTGGLGPTEDDLTRSLTSEIAGVPLLRNEKAFSHLLERLGDRAYGANEKQAYIPEGFLLMDNPNGTAPGFYGRIGITTLFFLPGPPREMEPMFYSSVLPIVRQLMDIPEEDRLEYSSFITAEARLEELFEEVDPGLDWATRFQDYRISIYISGGSRERIKVAADRLAALVGPYRLVPGDESALGILKKNLLEADLTLSVAESCSGGLLSSLLTSEAGSSSYFKGGVISYATEVKNKVLSVQDLTIEEEGVISRKCAEEMAEGVLKLLDSDYAVSITGVAGPGRQEDKPVGTVCIGLAGSSRRTESVALSFNSWGRESVRRRASVSAMLFLSAYIRGENVSDMVEKWRNI